MNNTSSTLHVCYCSDQNLLRQMLVSAQSVFENTSSPVHFHFIVSADAEEEFHALYQSMCTRTSPIFSHFTVYAVTTEEEGRLPTNDFMPSSSCYRFMMEKFISDTVPYVFYFDVDTLVTGDIATIPLPVDSLLSAVTDIGVVRVPPPHHRTPDFQNFDRYFNTGILIVNMQQWRTREIASRTLAIAGKYVLYDQDALNVLGKNLWTNLPQQWNQLTEYMPRASHWFWFLRLHRIFPVTIPKGILHFISPTKPWKKYSISLYRFYYWDYFQQFFPDYPLRPYGTLLERLLCWTPNWLYRIYLRLLHRPYTYDFLERDAT